MSDTQYEVIVFGASSFVGQIICEYLSSYRGEESPLRWAMAGRNERKLQETRDALSGDKPDLLIADSSDEVSLRAMAAKAQVVLSTVGPYALYGEALVKVCAETGTDYCDLTGEVHWIRAMIDRYQTTASQSGARLVHCCGFDSIPSDLGVLFTQTHFRERYGHPSEDIRMRVKAAKGGLSGGTFASLLNVMKEASEDPALRKQMADPYLLCPGAGFHGRQRNPGLAELDVISGRWMSPFIMAAINTRVVQRSHYLLGKAYGDHFRYEETMLTGTGLAGRLRASAIGGGLAAFMLGAAIKPGRWLLEKLLPAPGEGPSPEAQQKGFFDMRFYALSGNGETLQCKVTGDRDPGYGATAKMISQAALCLARDVNESQCAGGSWTPASSMGVTLMQRLEQHAGMQFAVVEE